MSAFDVFWDYVCDTAARTLWIASARSRLVFNKENSNGGDGGGSWQMVLLVLVFFLRVFELMVPYDGDERFRCHATRNSYWNVEGQDMLKDDILERDPRQSSGFMSDLIEKTAKCKTHTIFSLHNELLTVFVNFVAATPYTPELRELYFLETYFKNRFSRYWIYNFYDV